MEEKRKRIKQAIICKGVGVEHVDFQIDSSIIKTYVPKAGDVAIFEVMEIGKHSSLQGLNGNNRYLFPTDWIMGTFGTRYATEQFEGYVPDGYREEYHILGKGGAIGILHSTHVKFAKKGPTRLKLIGYATKDGEVINTKYLLREPKKFNPNRKLPFKVVLSIGASMDSGKTTSAAFLCRGISQANKKVAYVKLTGTVYAKDRSFVRDCGADFSTDFSIFGFPSTYMCSIDDILDLYEGLLDVVEEQQPDYLVMEIADGLLQRETSQLLQYEPFMSTVYTALFSAGDSLGVIHGLNLLKKWGVPVFAIAGLFTASPLLAREVEELYQDTHYLPILGLDGLSDPGVVKHIETKKYKRKRKRKAVSDSNTQAQTV